VEAALSAVNTWHYRLETHQWKASTVGSLGTRTPFFYREQIGSQIVQDDGKARSQIFGSDSAFGSHR